MNLFTRIKHISGNIKKLRLKKKLMGIVVALFIGSFLITKIFFPSQNQSTYQTSQAERGTLIKTITASGQITAANNVAMTIQAAGVVKEVYVKNGDSVTQGQKIAELTLDQASQQKAAAAYASYLSAQNNLNSATAKMNSLQSALFKANQTFINDKGIPNPSDSDKANPKYIEENADWLQAEADYTNQQTVIAASQASLNSASLTLSQTSSTITAPVAGTVRGLTITPGAIVMLSSANTNSASTSQVLGSIYQTGPIQAQVALSEIDVVNVSEGQKVTLTLDAFPDSTFTGKLISIDTNGVVSSGVTTYPAVISFDSDNSHIYPNMGVSANIITKIKNDVIMVPTQAVQTSQNGQSTVRVLKNNSPVSVPVEIGDSNDIQTEITSGINEGDTVVTSVASQTTTQTQGTASPFSGLGGGRGFGGATRGR